MSSLRFTFDLEEELKNLDAGVANPANPDANIRNIRNIRNQAHLNLKDESADISQEDHSWRDFYPDLNPADFEISETDYGVYGEKTSGKMAGTLGFLIPWERLEQGPPVEKKNSKREEWDFSRLYLPSQTDPGKVDVSMVGTRLGQWGFRFWFVRSEPKN